MAGCSGVDGDEPVGMDVGMPGLGGMRAPINNAANKGMAFGYENHCKTAMHSNRELAFKAQARQGICRRRCFALLELLKLSLVTRRMPG